MRPIEVSRLHTTSQSEINTFGKKTKLLILVYEANSADSQKMAIFFEIFTHCDPSLAC